MSEILYRIPREGKIFGVCAGLASYLNVDVTLVRVIFVLLAFVSGGTAIVVYIVLAVLLPEKLHFSAGDRHKSFSFAERVQTLGDEINRNNVIPRFRNYFGFGLIIIGGLLLADLIFPRLFVIRWDYAWPLFLIVVGVMVIFRKGATRR